MKKLGAGFPAKRETRGKISGELYLVALARRRVRCRPVRPTRITTGWADEDDEKLENSSRRRRRQGWAIGQRGTRNGGRSGTFILRFLRPSPLRSFPTLHPSATATSFPPSPPSYRLFFWFFPVTSPPLPLLCLALASKVTPRNPCGKVWLFNFLPWFARVLSLLLPLFFYISQGSRSALFSPHPSRFAVTHATKPVHFSATDDRYFLSSSLLFVAGNNFLEGKICRAWSLRKTDTTDSAIRIHLQLWRYFCVCM